MPTGTVDPLPFGRVSWAVLAGLSVLAILAGIQPIVGPLATFAPVLAVPAAAGLPFLIPPLRTTPVGETTWAFWAADIAGAAVMLGSAFVLLRAAQRRRPDPGPARAFGRAVGVTTLALIAGNIIRGVFSSFVVYADPGTYLGTMLGNIAVSGLTGAVLGLVVGVVAATVAAVGRSTGAPSADLVPQDDTPRRSPSGGVSS
ncbi:hypothetical protein [Agromyces sp. GXS1127]|uniref:hypothetical protein n=1 Tax=Agromyces sp. GXS1127 TaxID=3424181 RepID=UPI003D319FF4